MRDRRHETPLVTPLVEITFSVAVTESRLDDWLNVPANGGEKRGCPSLALASRAELGRAAC
jgi:hypothetical protein